MTKKSHTPGPWMAAAKPSSIVGWPICGPMGRVIGDVAIINRQGAGSKENFDAYYAECEANAHLIATAPELLAVLKDITSFLQNGDLSTRAGFIECARLGSIADAAIAKAEGV